MAKNTGNNFRRGAVTGRTQFQRPTAITRSATNGRGIS